jgi:RNA-directed DNA polymerase
MKRGNARGGKGPGWSCPAEGNVVSTTETQETTDTVLRRIAWLSASDASKRFESLMHLFNQGSLAACFHALDGRKAVGADGITKVHYGADLDRNLEGLVERLKRMGYRPGPVREVLIPKGGKAGATRPLGISNLEDKLVQGMVRKVLEALYEPLFLDCSYGFRPGRGAHDAVRDLQHYLYSHEVERVIDIDISSYFDTIDQSRLLEMLSEKVADPRFLRYLARLLKAGVLSQGELRFSEEGVVQGSACSPVLANIFAHYVIDQWFEDTVKRHCAGEVALFRYADDMVICCRSARDGERIRKALTGRLARFGLSLNEAKTRMVPFRRPGRGQRGRGSVFAFLGFTFYWGRSRQGYAIPKVKTSAARLRAKLVALTQWAKAVHSRYPLAQFWRLFCAKVRGHVRYYGVSFNTRALSVFVHQAVRIVYKWLNRRSQRRSFTWETFRLYIARHPLPRLVVFHALY